MWSRRAAVSTAGILAVAIVGACADTPPTEPRAEPSDGVGLFGGPGEGATSLEGGLDGHFERIAQDIPGFAGFFFDEAGTLNVVMAPAAQPLSRSEVQNRIAAHLEALGEDPAAARGAVMQQGEYDFIQLNALRRQARSVLSLAGTVFLDADEVRNRVVVGVEDDAAAASVERAVAMLGLPSGAVVLVRSEPIELDQSLRDVVRPVGGGLQIAWDRAGSTILCSHGFNVRPHHPAGQHIHGFVTNSHCSRERSNMLSTPYWQPSRVAANLIGEEEHDAPFFTGAPCPAGRVCRWSDSLGARYAPGVFNVLGIIYRTLFPGTTSMGSLDIDPANPTWQIVGENVTVVGQTLHKTGRTSGWTMGPVTATCQDVNTSPNITLFCQHRILNLRQGGDSGSPYFLRVGGTSNVMLAGLHWGGSGFDAVMSPIQNIRQDNPGPQPWITFPGQDPPPTP
jgi:hypothetical protein